MDDQAGTTRQDDTQPSVVEELDRLRERDSLLANALSRLAAEDAGESEQFFKHGSHGSHNSG